MARLVHEVHLPPFSIDTTSVTNAQFARFVDDTGYVTEAESFGFSAVFHLALETSRENVMSSAGGDSLVVRGARGGLGHVPAGLALV